MLHVGLDLSRRRVDVCVLSDEGELVEELAASPDAEGLRYLVSKLARHREPVRPVIESMTGARYIHDTLEQLGWEVLIADAQRVKGLAPVACKTDRVDSRVLAMLSHRDLVPAIWLPDPRVRSEREQAPASVSRPRRPMTSRGGCSRTPTNSTPTNCDAGALPPANGCRSLASSSKRSTG